MGLQGQWPEQLPYQKETAIALSVVLPIFCGGAVLGLLLPRPKWLEAGLSGASFISSPVGLLLRRLTLLYQAAYLLRALWNHLRPSSPAGQMHAPEGGLRLEGKHRHHKVRRRGHQGPKADAEDETGETDGEQEALSRWYVQGEDLEFFKDRVERPTPFPGCGDWELVMAKDFGGGVRYSAWKRHLADGKTDYKSVTVAEDATAQEFMDFYLDDDARARWDPMISHHETVETGPANGRCQVVRWVRSFPFSFIKEREYIIARRAWQQQGCLYGITKCIPHPRAAYNHSIVRMDTFYSMWRSRTIPCPKGTERPACETVLLHREDFKIPEKMARFAVRHGMAGFVKKMSQGVHPFVEARRARVDRFEEDPDAYGMKRPLDPPGQELARSLSGASATSVLSAISDVGTADTVSDLGSPRAGPYRKRRRFGPVKQFGCALLGTWAAVVISGVR